MVTRRNFIQNLVIGSTLLANSSLAITLFEDKSIRGMNILDRIAWYDIPMIEHYISSLEINTLMINLKNTKGNLCYYPVSLSVQDQFMHLGNPTLDIGYLNKLKERYDLKLIGRHVMFWDNRLYESRPDLRMTEKGNQKWVDLRKQEVVDYNLRLLEDENLMWFDEIVLDYIRFPVVPGFGSIDYKCDVIDNIVRQANDVVDNLGVHVFGIACWDYKAANIGQRLETLDSHVDTIYPMLYPSLFAKGSFGYDDPNEHPYDFIAMGYEEARKKVKSSDIIPMIQGFGFEPWQIAEQIRATKDLDMPGYVCWQPDQKKFATALKL